MWLTPPARVGSGGGVLATGAGGPFGGSASSSPVADGAAASAPDAEAATAAAVGARPPSPARRARSDAAWVLDGDAAPPQELADVGEPRRRGEVLGHPGAGCGR